MVVTRGEELAAARTERLVEELQGRKLAVERVLVNRVLPKTADPAGEERRRQELLVAKALEKKIGLPVTVAPGPGRYPAGLRELKSFRTAWYALTRHAGQDPGRLSEMAGPGGFALEFERPLIDLEKKIDELKALSRCRLGRLQRRDPEAGEEGRSGCSRRSFSDLSRWQVTQLSRHPARPYFLDYVQLLFTDFFELRRRPPLREDPSIVGRLGPASTTGR